MAALYSLHNLTRRFGEREVLCIDALEIEPGDTYALLGPNGAGKSTLLRLLAFLDAPSSGDLIYKGRKVTPGQLARFRPGVVLVSQFPAMFTGSLLYNIEYPLALKKIPRPERRKTALELLELVKLEQLVNAPAHRLSGGECQRAGIARALAAGAQTLLFDEPTANADQRSVGDFIRLTRDICKRQNLTVLISTHNPELAATICRRQIFLSGGRLADKRLLPGGEAWPGQLRRPEADDADTAGANILHLPVQAVEAFDFSQTNAVSVLVRGLNSVAAGTRLTVEITTGRTLDILLEDTESIALAGSLTLGSVLVIKQL
ncbi:MAG: ABC transporter ATP-binding protein [Deltaproteobacteria bacterium]|jgi:ABC-type multidrug transport system ATPase subunit|nr:ABC transporter ATP-binding protein [Deltaproteobacteria bacterium]